MSIGKHIGIVFIIFSIIIVTILILFPPSSMKQKEQQKMQIETLQEWSEAHHVYKLSINDMPCIIIPNTGITCDWSKMK